MMSEQLDLQHELSQIRKELIEIRKLLIEMAANQSQKPTAKKGKQNKDEERIRHAED